MGANHPRRPGAFVERTIVRLGAAGRIEESALRTEFESAYRKPGVKYLGAAAAVATCASLCYYFLEASRADSPWLGGVQTLRLLLAATCALIAVLCWTKRHAASRYYGPVFSAIVTAV